MAKVNRRSPWDEDQPAVIEESPSTPVIPAKVSTLTKVAPASGASRRINFDVDDALHRRIRMKAARPPRFLSDSATLPRVRRGEKSESDHPSSIRTIFGFRAWAPLKPRSSSMAGPACHTPALGFVTMAEDSPTLDELRQRIADIEAGKAAVSSERCTQGEDLRPPSSRRAPTQDAIAFAEDQQVVTRSPKLIECNICHCLSERTCGITRMSAIASHLARGVVTHE